MGAAAAVAPAARKASGQRGHSGSAPPVGGGGGGGGGTTVPQGPEPQLVSIGPGGMGPLVPGCPTVGPPTLKTQVWQSSGAVYPLPSGRI